MKFVLALVLTSLGLTLGISADRALAEELGARL